MSMRALPLLYLNLGGEMMYILDQRLRAQNISKDKAKKVLLDIIGAMFNGRLMEELFKPQDLYTKKSIRTMFDHLAHASIMRLNEGSMDKLYDLMTMAFKYQVIWCKRPQDLLLVTLNHLDVIRSYASGSVTVGQQVELVYKLLKRDYVPMSAGQLMLARQKLLGFFQDMHVRVSLFLRDQIQDGTGKFILPISGSVPGGVEIPGKIRYFKPTGERIQSVEFITGGTYSPPTRDGSYELAGDRVINLGTNMYDGAYSGQEAIATRGSSRSSSVSDFENSTPDPRAKAQLDLLSRLIGGSQDGKKKGGQPEFKLNLFNLDEDEGLTTSAIAPAAAEDYGYVVNIDASKKKQSAELSRIMGDMGDMHLSRESDDRRHRRRHDDDRDYDEDDLLDLMDNAGR